MTFLPAAALLFVFSSCKKENNPGGLNATWTLVEVYDKNQHTTSNPPAENGNDLSITLSSEKFSGHTLRNMISNGTYTLPPGNQILFGSYAMTKVNEDM